jgi:oligosaccharide repeat unit polymerase
MVFELPPELKRSCVGSAWSTGSGRSELGAPPQAEDPLAWSARREHYDTLGAKIRSFRGAWVSTTNLCLLAVSSLLLANLLLLRRASRPWTYPPALLTGAWSVTLLVYALQGADLWTLDHDAAVVILLGVVCFSLGSFIALTRHCDDDFSNAQPDEDELRSGRWILVVLAIGLPFYIWQTLGAGGLSGSALVDAREAGISSSLENQRGVLAYLVPFAVFGTALHLLGAVKTTRFRTCAMIALSLAYCTLTTSRFSFVLLFAIVATGRAVQGHDKAWALLLIGGGAFFGVFGGMAFLLDKGVDDGGEAVSQTASIFVHYLVAGVAGLNDHVQNGENVALTWGTNMFRSLIALAAVLGSGVPPKPLIMEFRFVPIQTNVYTVFRAYLEDFGLLGVIATQLAFGFVHTLLWLRARQRDPAAAFLYGAMSFCAVMQVFQDNYFSAFSLWCQGLVLLCIVRPRPPGVPWWRWGFQPSADAQPAG